MGWGEGRLVAIRKSVCLSERDKADAYNRMEGAEKELREARHHWRSMVEYHNQCVLLLEDVEKVSYGAAKSA